MKKQALIFALFISLVISSCKKSYTCVCSTPTYVLAGISIKDTKKKAKKACKDNENNGANNPAVVCEISK